jgi:hypothetical protein
MRKSTVNQIATIGLLAMFALTTACTTMIPITAPTGSDAMRADLKTGDKVRALTKDGATHTLSVTEIGASSLIGSAIFLAHSGTEPVGSRVEVPYEAMSRLEVQRVKVGTTVLIVAVGALAIAAAVASGGGHHGVGYGNN